MKLEHIVTLENQDRYYIAAETTQEGKKYFLANKLDDNDDMTDSSLIFEEMVQGEDIYVDEVKDEKLISYLTVIFTSDFIETVEDFEYSEED